MSTMRPSTFAWAIALPLIVLAGHRAQACGQGSNYAGILTAFVVGGIVVGAADVGLTGVDLASLASGEHRSVGYGVGETLLAAPQLALAAYGLTINGNKSFFAVYTAWMSLLMAHGMWTIATGSDTIPVPPEPLDRRPPPEPMPRLQMTLGPTYVPLGNAAQPGFGILGRF
jgi:hypothetical protein